MVKTAKPEMMNELKEIVYKFFPKNIMKEEELYEESKEHKRFIELKETFIENESSQQEVLSLIESTFCDEHVLDCTDLNLYNCLEYNVLLNGREPMLNDDIEWIQKSRGERLDLGVFVSLLDKYYYYYVLKTTYDEEVREWTFETIDVEMDTICEFETRMNTKGFVRVEREIARTAIPDIETECLRMGEVNVFHALFTDSVSEI
ncbi:MULTISPECIES: hypothetical protein [Bacillus]|uniref:hypothetical protein n=1 Tax=Bacillus TaxID=1386 RepID=UPI000BF9D306|nr:MULTISPECIES: hypothetical protein [Bacillus cereus group]KAA6467982.1 hypothetical protein DX930_02070 [Bacillus cereus]KAB2413122.1 hypothetical protein F8169_22255 [Bacillus cereus]KAB2432919.1 hypothetical protein F8166_26145 [Bacillus cereus]KAB2465336.1 hypothetical protein F8164_26900 [Bacillus cereus]MCC2544559.1 hypothetical protein [Bacillus thuringiensis]